MKKKFEGIHLEPAYGSYESQVAYCSKDGIFFARFLDI